MRAAGSIVALLGLGLGACNPEIVPMKPTHESHPSPLAAMAPGGTIYDPRAPRALPPRGSLRSPTPLRGSGSIPAWFVGAWKREWIQEPGGAPDGTKTVRDIQTPTVFGSVRIPGDRPAFPGATSLADLTDAELATLARQNGFAGVASADGNVVTWHHEIDYQPAGDDDIGRLEQVSASGVYEHALDDSFTEYWWSLSAGDGKTFAARVVGADGRVAQILSVVGDHFVYARNRARDLPAGDSLAELIARTHASRPTILAYLDCELSYGLVRGGAVPWQNVHSTLPWREGAAADFARQIAIDPQTGALTPQGRTASGETWSYPVRAMTVEDLRVLFPGPHQD